MTDGVRGDEEDGSEYRGEVSDTHQVVRLMSSHSVIDRQTDTQCNMRLHTGQLTTQRHQR